ncbi:unnamed protein product, partial [Staurois parvus]
MIGTSYRGPVQRSVFRCVLRTERAPNRGAARSQGARTGCKCVYERQPASALLPSGPCTKMEQYRSGL